MQDLRFAFRQLLKDPSFTAVAVLTLALGIGANTALFSVVNAVLLRPLPYDEPGRLVQAFEAPQPGQRNAASPGAFLDWKEHATVFESLSLRQEIAMNLTGDGDPERIHGLGMSAGGLEILRARPWWGRLFAPDEDQPGKDKVVVLSHEFWQRRFGGETNVVGRAIRLNDESYTVVGILPPYFLPWDKKEFVVPAAIAPSDANQRSAHWIEVIGRLKPGVTVEQAGAEMNALMSRLKSLYPPHKKDWGVTLVSIQEQLTGDIRPTLLVLLGAVGCVLLIACANVANLLLARASSRQREMAIRSALGATRGRVIRQLLVESVLLSAMGAGCGLVLAAWSVSAVTQAEAVSLPRAQEIGLDLRALGFTVLLSLVAGLAFGLAPAFHAARPNLGFALKDGTRGSGEGSGNRMRSGLIVAEVALSLILLVGAGLLLNSFYRLVQVPPGIDPHNVLTFQVPLPEKKYPDAAHRTAFFDQVLERVRSLPGVEAAGVVRKLPLGGWPDTSSFSIIGRPDQPPAGHLTDFDFCTSDYFRVVGIPLLRGRTFGPRDKPGAPGVVLINEALARKHFPNEDPLGKRIHLEVFAGKLDEGWEIVGVVGDVRQRGLADDAKPCVYRPQSFGFWGGESLVIRTSSSPLSLAEAARKAVLEVDPAQPVVAVRTLEQVVGASIAQRRFVLMLLGGFAGGALLLTAIGLYGVIAYAVSRRTREIGIRMALGATRRSVLGLVLGGGIKLAVLGVAVGVVGALALSRALATLLYEVRPTDPLTFAEVSLILLLVALLACWLPARRAARVDPMEALRNEG